MALTLSRLVPVTRALALLGALTALALPPHATAQAKKDSVILGMVLEPAPGLDPTVAPAAAIGEVVHLSVLEGLTKINMDGKITPLLAESWTTDPDGKVYTFKLKKGVKFHDGEAFDARRRQVQLRARQGARIDQQGEEGGVRQHQQHRHARPVHGDRRPQQRRRQLPVPHGREHGGDPRPEERADEATRPIGTGPFKFESWAKGSSITLVKNDLYRDAAKIAMKKVTFRFIDDPAAQVAALLAGDVDGMPRYGALESLKQFQSDPRFAVVIGGTEGKTIMTINNKKKPFDDVRVRRALAAAIDRKAIIDGAQEGYGTPIGSHFLPSDAGYVDLTSVNPYNPEKAKALLKDAGVRRRSTSPSRCRRRPTRARAARSSPRSWPRSASSPRSRTSSGRSGCRARSRATST